MIAFLLTGLIDGGGPTGAASLWTPETAPAGSWSAETDNTDLWTPETPPAGSWS